MQAQQESISIMVADYVFPFFMGKMTLNNFLKHKLILSHTHTHTSLIPTPCSPTVEWMKSFTCGAVGWQRLFCSCANICTHTYTLTYTLVFLCVTHVSRLNWTHMWLLSAGGSGAFIIHSPSHSSKPENSKSCCVVTKSPLTLWVELTRRIRPRSGWGRQVFLAGIWRIWISKRDIWLAENCKTYFKRWKSGHLRSFYKGLCKCNL